MMEKLKKIMKKKEKKEDVLEVECVDDSNM